MFAPLCRLKCLPGILLDARISLRLQPSVQFIAEFPFDLAHTVGARQVFQFIRITCRVIELFRRAMHVALNQVVSSR